LRRAVADPAAAAAVRVSSLQLWMEEG